MRKSTILVFTLLFFSFASGWAGAEDNSMAEILARELLEVSGVIKMGPQVTQQLIQLRKKTMPDIPEQFWKDFAREVHPDGLNKKIIPIYAKHFSIEEMKTLIAFYKTDAGQKYLNKLPEITKETMEVGRAWSMEIRMKLTEKLKTADLKNMKK